MNIVFISEEDTAPWKKALRRRLPEADVFFWGEGELDKAAMDYALVWKPEPGLVASFPNLKGIFNLGAGVDALLQDTTLPRNVPLVRLVDPRLSQGMVEYVVYWVVHFHRDMQIYARHKRVREWRQYRNADTAKRRVGILGLGELGTNCAHALLMLGFETVSGWSRTHKELPGVTSFAGKDALKPFLQQCEILVNLLPLTDATHRILDQAALDQLPEGAFVINAGRGATLDETALIEALNSGHLAGAALDVFATEPLPQDHPFWTMDTVFITPHIASLTSASSAADVIAKALRALEDGETPDNLVDWDQGY